MTMPPPGAYPPPPPPPRRSGLGPAAMTVVVVSVLGVLALIGFTVVAGLKLSDSAMPGSGDCLRITRTSSDGAGGDVQKIGCDDRFAVYSVDRTGSSACSDGDYVKLAVRDTDHDNVQVVLCLALNVREGECLTAPEDETTIAKTDCFSDQAKKQAHVAGGLALPPDCTDTQYLFRYRNPNRTVCLADVVPSQHI